MWPYIVHFQTYWVNIIDMSEKLLLQASPKLSQQSYSHVKAHDLKKKIKNKCGYCKV